MSTWRLFSRWMLRAARLLAPALLLLVSPAPSRATILVLGPLGARAGRADAIAVVRVDSTRAAWSGGRIVTTAWLEVEQVVKGGLDRRAQVVVPGGRVNGVAMKVLGGAELRAGERAILFLSPSKASGARGLIDLGAGKLGIARDAIGFEWVTGEDGVPRALSDVVDELKRDVPR